MPESSAPALRKRNRYPTPPDEYHTEAEVIAALEALTDTEIRYLVGFARYRILGADPDDLCSDAMLRTLKLKRKWRRGVSLRNHLIACMHSIASKRFERASQNTELSPQLPAPSTDLERALDAKANVSRLQNELRRRADSVALAVLDTLLEGFLPQKSQEFLRMRPKVYDAAKKRIRRLADKLFGSQKGVPHA